MTERDRRPGQDPDDRYEELDADADDEESIVEDADRYADATRDSAPGMSERVESAVPDEVRVRPDGTPRNLAVRRGEHQPQHENPEERKDPSLRNEDEWLTEGYSKEDLDLDESEERIDHP